MKMLKKTLAVILVLAMVLSVAVFPASAAQIQFTDVNSGDWYADSVTRWADAGIISGYQDGSFQPLNNVKRSEFAKIMAAVLGLTEQAENIFADVPNDAWYAPYVLACVKAGIINGYEENGLKYFKADNYITRQEAIKMYVVALQLTGGEYTNLKPYPDADNIGDWAKSYVKTILSYGAVEGKSDGGLDPLGNIRRAEVAIILDRLVGVYVSSTGAVSTTTKAESDKTGNLVIVHAACQDTVSVSAEKKWIIVSVGNEDTIITPTNGKTPAVLVADSKSEVKPGQTVNLFGGELPQVLKVAAIETAYGSQVWADVAAAFEAETGIKVELTTSKNLEDVIAGPMQNDDYPDVVHLATGRPAGLTEQLIQANALHDISNVLSMTVPGETVKVSDKLIGGFTDSNTCAPYGDGKVYLAPMFYSPCGLFYNANLFEAKGWEVPTTWDEMWALGETAAAEGISLFTYPTAGYLDAFLYALANAVGGPEFFNAITTYEDGAWDSADGKTLLAILDKLADYTHPDTPINATNWGFTKNQQMPMNGTALFMPNGTWITGEMAEYASTLKNFAWGMTAVPSAGTAPYSFCWFEQAWIPAGAEHITEAEQFVAFLYSDTAAEIFASAGAMQPILGLADMLEGENRMFYSIYEGGAKAAVGGFAPFDEIPGVDVASTFFAPIDSLVAGTITIEDYADLVKTNSALMRENLLN